MKGFFFALPFYNCVYARSFPFFQIVYSHSNFSQIFFVKLTFSRLRFTVGCSALNFKTIFLFFLAITTEKVRIEKISLKQKKRGQFEVSTAVSGPEKVHFTLDGFLFKRKLLQICSSWSTFIFRFGRASDISLFTQTHYCDFLKYFIVG